MALSPLLLQGANPGNTVDYANEAAKTALAQQMGQTQLQSAQDELANKRRAMAISMLNGIANEQDPDKQAALYATIKPMAERYDPTLKLPDAYDPSLGKALLQSQIPAEKQAQMANDLQKAQILAGGRANQIETDPVTGAKYIINKLDGSRRPITAQDAAALGVSGDGTPSDATPTPPAFGFDLGSVNPATFKEQAKTDAKRLQAYQSNHQRIQNALPLLDAIEANLGNFQTGSGGDLRLAADKAANMFLPSAMGEGFKTVADAGNNIDKNSNDLVTQLQGFEYVPGQRAGVLGLKTMLASKPGIGQQDTTNRNIISELRGRLNDYQLSEELAQAYKEASPLKVIDPNAEKLDDALKTIYPLQSVDQKTGVVTFHPESVDRIREAIPDALANPQKYFAMAKEMKPGTAADEARARIQQPTQPQAETHDQLPDPEQYKGKIATDQTTGEKFLSDGKQWVKQ